MSRAAIEERIKAHPVTGTPAEMRLAFARLMGSSPIEQMITLGGVRCAQFGTGPIAVWLHGGGYVFGSARSHARAARALAERAMCAVIVPEYRLAPEHPWPAALQDACRVVDACRTPVMLVGDSAGGHLALTVARRRPDQVRKLVLISPNTDRSGRSQTRRANTATDLMNADEDDRRLARIAMPDHDPSHPDISPILADLSMLPPTFVTASTREVLLDDALLLIGALGRAGVPVTAEIIAHLWHLWPLWPGELPQADQTLRAIAAFLTRSGNQGPGRGV
ncbi:MAG: alpha/beta hydrolase fold domain-containing protein [Pseudomonadota bacterium]